MIAQTIKRHGKEAFIKSFKGQGGYIKLSLFLDASLDLTFSHTSKMLEPSEMDLLNWEIFIGKVKDYMEFRRKILDSEGQVRKEYIGKKGYLLASGLTGGRMFVTYSNAVAAFTDHQMQALNWKPFPGTATDYLTLKKVLFVGRKLNEKYKHREGYLLLAEGLFKGDMEATYDYIYPMLTADQLAELGWGEFHGSSREYRVLRRELLNHDGSVEESYRLMDGYELFQARYFDINNLDKFSQALSMIGQEELFNLGWGEIF